MPPKRDAETKDKRTKSTIYLTEHRRELIEKSGKTVQKFYEDLTDQYEAFDMARWREGHMYLRQMRKMMVGTGTISLLASRLADPHASGKIAGEAAAVTNLSILNLDARIPEDRKSLFNLISRVSGWGIFTEPSTDIISIESPAITNEPFLRGYMEGFLSCRLQTVEAPSDRMIFQIIEA